MSGINRMLGAAAAAAVGLLTAGVAVAQEKAAPVQAHGNGWWLPPNYSTHGGAMDNLFLWIFWITMIILVAVQVTLVVFLVKYRYKPERKKAVFTHGNTRLEMAWTLAPAVILIILAMFSKRVWDDYRFSPLAQEAGQATYLVVGERFKWNVVYAGADGKIGRYLTFPKPTDAKWPQRWDAEKKAKVDVTFEGVPGPASLPFDRAVKAISNYIDTENRMGKDLSDPAGADDDWTNTPGRPQFIPVDTPVTIYLSSKDVIHDYFLPNFRVKLDAVPGMRGVINFKAVPGCETFRVLPIDSPELVGKTVWIDKDTTWGEGAAAKSAEYDRRTNDYRIPDPARPRTTSIVRNLGQITEAQVEKLKKLGLKEIGVLTQPYDLVCEELCGQGHYSMRGEVYVLPKAKFANFVTKGQPAATQPAVAAVTAAAVPAN